MLATLKLGEKFSLTYLSTLVLALCGLLTLRFYVFYIIVIAVAAAFVLGRRQLTAQSLARQMIIIILVGVGLGYFGVSRYASQQIETFASADQLYRIRLDASQSAASGFAEDVDVSTASGALSTVPLGLTYLLLAPFPWQISNVRQAITLREIEGLSYEEIADVMNCPIGTVRSRIFRAREAIASRLRPLLGTREGERW
jgi:hypothetical protein